MAACESRAGLSTTADADADDDTAEGIGNGTMLGCIGSIGSKGKRGNISRFAFIRNHDRTEGESPSTKEGG